MSDIWKWCAGVVPVLAAITGAYWGLFTYVQPRDAASKQHEEIQVLTVAQVERLAAEMYRRSLEAERERVVAKLQWYESRMDRGETLNTREQAEYDYLRKRLLQIDQELKSA